MFAEIKKTAAEILAGARNEFRTQWRRLPEARRQLVAKVFVGTTIGVAAIVLITGLGIYALGWQNAWSRAVSRVVPYPAGYVDGQVILYRAYAVEAHSQEVTRRQGGDTEKIAGKELNEQAMGVLVNDALIRRWAREHRITVSSREVANEVVQVLSGLGGEKAGREVLRSQYGLSRADFVKRTEGQLLREKVEAAMAREDSAQRTARETATKVVDELKGGKDFATLTNQYSQHASAIQAGEAALVSTVALPERVAAKAYTMKDGESSDYIAAEDRFYIIKRERATADAVLVRVIMLQPSTVADWLRGELGKVDILVLTRQAWSRG